MNLFRISLIIIILSGCSVVGEKEVLIAKNSEWKTNKLFSNVTYKYQCENFWVQLDEVVFRNQTSSYGVILPVIPSGKLIDKTDDNLELRFTIGGKVESIKTEENDFKITVKQDNIDLLPVPKRYLYKTSEKPFEGALWIQYDLNYSFSIKLKEINELSIKLTLPFKSCNPSVLLLKREKVINNEFILAPGA